MSDERFDRLDDKISEVKDELSLLREITADQKAILAVNTASLAEHMRRSIALEENNNLLRKSISDQKDFFMSKFSVVDKLMDRIKFSGILIAGIGSGLVTLQKLGVFPHLLGK